MPDRIWEPYPKLEAKMPWRISEQDGKFCVVKKSDGKVVKCHSTRKEAKSHIAALYVNEPSAAKKSVGYGMLKSLIEEKVVELKACGANKPGGGGFAAGNTCARGSGGGAGQRKKAENARSTEAHITASAYHSARAKETSAGISGLHQTAALYHSAAAERGSKTPLEAATAVSRSSDQTLGSVARRASKDAHNFEDLMKSP